MITRLADLTFIGDAWPGMAPAANAQWRNFMKYAVVYSTHRGTNYLSGFETFCFGSRMLGYFTRSPSCALPLSYNRACQFRDILHRDMPASLYHVDPKSNLPVGLQVIPYPGESVQEGGDGNE